MFGIFAKPSRSSLEGMERASGRQAQIVGEARVNREKARLAGFAGKLKAPLAEFAKRWSAGGLAGVFCA